MDEARPARSAGLAADPPGGDRSARVVRKRRGFPPGIEANRDTSPAAGSEPSLPHGPAVFGITAGLAATLVVPAAGTFLRAGSSTEPDARSHDE